MIKNAASTFGKSAFIMAFALNAMAAQTVTISAPAQGNPNPQIYTPGANIHMLGQASWSGSSVDTIYIILKNIRTTAITATTSAMVNKPTPSSTSGSWQADIVATQASGHQNNDEYYLEAEGHNAAIGPFMPRAFDYVTLYVQ